MQKVTKYDDGSRDIHTYEEMTPEKRPQDPHMDGTGLRFEPREHHGLDLCPEAVILTDAEGRHCTYVAQGKFSDEAERPQDSDRDGRSLRFETLEHGAEHPDKMPQALRVTDPQGRSCLYWPITEDGKVVDSRGYRRETPDWPGERAEAA
ncbi:MAG: hypothetical protein ACJ8FM_02720 [Xanthobacteraceae bacterium]